MSVGQSDFSAAKVSFSHKVAYGVAIFVLSFAGGWLGGSSRVDNKLSIENQPNTSFSGSKNTGNTIRSIADSVGPSVVSINVTSAVASSGSDLLYSQLFGYDLSPKPRQSAGTGVIISQDGLVMTNRHVVPSGVTKVSVTLSDGTELEDVRVLDRTANNDSLDIAFLKIGDTKGKKLTVAKLGDSSKMRIGDSVVAIGNTLGQFQNTVTTGILSGYGRSIQASGGNDGVETLDDLFQTDAAINQGNSGGPLVNMGGEVVGINTAIAEGAQTVGFAIPINNVKGIIKSIEKTGKIERPYLGVRYVLLTDDIAKELRLKASRGAYIPKSADGGGVIKGGPADKSGIKEGDVITKIDGKTIDEKTSLVSVLGKKNVGDTVRVSINRDGSVKNIDVRLGAANKN